MHCTAIGYRMNSRVTSIEFATIAVPIFAGCNSPRQASDAVKASSTPSVTSQDSAVTAEADDGTWVRPARDYGSTRFSGLTEITPATVKQLVVKSTFSTGFTRG